MPRFLDFLGKIIRNEADEEDKEEYRNPPSDTSAEQRKGTDTTIRIYLNPWRKKPQNDADNSCYDDLDAPGRLHKKSPYIFDITNKKKMMNSASGAKRSVGRHMCDFILIRV